MRFLRPFLVSLLAGAAVAGGLLIEQTSAGFAAGAPVVVEATAGYGVDTRACAAVGFDCERVVADSWCAAHGHDRSASVRRLATAGSDRNQNDRLVIRCE